ncbi:MAG: M3 family metallopeptidase [Fuerstiella sp.]
MDSNNPLSRRTGLPAFDAIKAEHVQPAVDEMLKSADALLSQATSSETGDWDAVMAPLGQIDLLFEYVWSPVSHLLSVANSDELRDVQEKCLPEIVQFGLKMSQNKPLYDRFKILQGKAEELKLDSGQQRILESHILSAEQSGIALSEEDQATFNQLSERMSKLTTDFSNNVLDATNAWSLEITDVQATEGWPASLSRMAAAAWNSADSANDQEERQATPEEGPWKITLEAPSFGPFMEHCRDSSLREQVYLAYLTRASSGKHDNSGLITEILKLRKQKCDLLGYESYAALSLSRKMAPNAEAVHQMFNDLLQASFDVGKHELQELTEFAKKAGHVGELKHWDVSFWAERMREEKYSFTDEELRPYFSLEKVMEGLFSLCHRLFGITIQAADGQAPVWHQDVRYFHVLNEDGLHIAGFYLDPYSRPENKRGGAWMNDCIGRSVTATEKRLPVAHLVCNGTPPVGDVPSLMTFREVETLFHEFGHGLQHMLTTVDHRDVAGISGVEWDAVELPSQFMENWCYHKPTLLGMAVHYESGQVLPDDLYDKICQARTYRAASGMLRQIQFGMTDMLLHSTFDPNGSQTAFEAFEEVAAKTSPMPPHPQNRFLCAFQHIFAGGYAAGYYSYKWAEVLSADAFAAFEEAGLDDESAVQKTGQRFRETVLSLGGSQHPMDVYREFRGRNPDTEALLRHNGLLTADGTTTA